MEKVDARSLSPKVQERLRQLAVKAVLHGNKQVEVANLFGATRLGYQSPAVFLWGVLPPNLRSLTLWGNVEAQKPERQNPSGSAPPSATRLGT
jgi:hypothetical protein